MMFAKRMRGVAALIGAMLICCGLFVPLAKAGYIVTLVQDGNDVIAAGSGTLDLAGLELRPDCTFGCRSILTLVSPTFGAIVTGPAGFAPTRFYDGFTGPTSFGSGEFIAPNGGSGDTVGIEGELGVLSVPLDYVSGSPLSDNSTYENQTLAGLGVIPGTYVWTWGSGATADSFTLDIVSTTVPEPSSLALLALPMVLVLTARRAVN